MRETKRGGSRPGNPNGRRGGARAGSGPKVRRLQLSGEAAQELNILLLHRRALTGNQELQAVDVVMQFIHEKWLEYDGMIQRLSQEGNEHV